MYDKPIDINSIISSNISKIEKELVRAKEAYLAEVFTLKEYKEIKERLESEKRKIEQELNNKDSRKTYDLELINKIKKLYTLYQKANTIKNKKSLLSQFVKCIYVFRDRIEVRFFG